MYYLMYYMGMGFFWAIIINGSLALLIALYVTYLERKEKLK